MRDNFDCDNIPIHGEDQQVGSFIEDFFQKNLPTDRSLVSPLPEYVIWRRMTGRLAAISWCLVASAICGLFAFSYFQNHRLIKIYIDQYPAGHPELINSLAVDIETLDTMRQVVRRIEAGNKSWMPRFGLNHSLIVEKNIKSRYLNMARKGVVAPLDSILLNSFKKIDRRTPEPVFVDYINFCIARIDDLKEAASGRRPSNPERFLGIAADIHADKELGISGELFNKYLDVYYDYLEWNYESGGNVKLLAQAQSILESLINKRAKDLRWLAGGLGPETEDVVLVDFWTSLPGLPELNKVKVPAAFTRRGRQIIYDFMPLIEDVLPEDNSFEKKRAAFSIWYNKQFYSSWYRFADGFHTAAAALKGEQVRADTAFMMAGNTNPYFQLLRTMAREFSSLNDGLERPGWANGFITISKARNYATAKEEKEKGSLVGKLKIAKENLIKKTAGKVDKSVVMESNLIEDIAAAWKNYTKNLNNLTPLAESKETCFKFLSDYFNNQPPAADQGSFQAVQDSLAGIGTLLRQQSPHNAPIIASVLSGPLDYIKAFTVDQAAFVLQDKWEEQVAGALVGVDSAKAGHFRFNKNDGLVWSFVNTVAKPFVTRDINGYRSRRYDGLSISFSKVFFNYLHKGRKQIFDHESEYTLLFEPMPMEVGQTSTIVPYSSTFTLQCADGDTIVENVNYKFQKKFQWVPDKCGDVSLSIELPGITLKKVYSGKFGLPKFLREFSDGSRTFSAKEFSDKEGILLGLGVSEISLAYKINGAEPVIALLNELQTVTPQWIIQQKNVAAMEGELFPSSFDVVLETLPIEVNDGADIAPYAVVFSLNCAEERFVLENANFRNTQKIRWSPETCSHVILDIQFPGVTLRRMYKGRLGFPNFLKDFSNGRKIFTVDQFPEAADYLAEKGVEHFSLGYKLTDEKPVLRFIERDAGGKVTSMINEPINLSSPLEFPEDTIRAEKWILAQSHDHFTLQLKKLRNMKGARSFYEQHNLLDSASYFQGSSREGNMYVLLYGIYPSKEEALNAIRELPEEVRLLAPQIRMLSSIQDDIRSQLNIK